MADRLRATPVLIPDTPDDLDSLDATIAHLQELGKPFLVDPIIEPIGSGFAASLGRYLETRRRHPDVEMLMGIGNLTELTEADTTGVTAALLGFCQELGIRNVLTTEVIDWARGAVREAVLAAQLMYFAQQEGTPPKHVDGRLLTIKDEEVRPYTEAELRELHASITDPNIRIFADADWIYAFNAERFVKGTDVNAIFDELGVDEPTHAFYLGKELMKASIARGLGKNYRQESPLDWGYLTFDEPRRERVRLTARPNQVIRRRLDRGGDVKKILLQLDTEEHPSPFDAIVAHDAGVDVLLSHGNVKREDARALAQDAFFTRGPDDLKNTAIWVGGKHVGAGEEIFAEVQKAFFGPFKVSVMLDSNGCNTTAATTIARIAKSYDLKGKRAVVIGLGSVGLRSAILLAKEGCEVVVAPVPPDLFGDDRPYRRPRGLDAAEKLGLDPREPKDRSELEATLGGRAGRSVRGAGRRRGAARGLLVQAPEPRAAGRLQRGRSARPRGHQGERRPRRLRRQARARRAGHRRAEDEGPQDLHTADVREQRRGLRHRHRLRGRQGARVSPAGPRVAGIDPGTVSFDVCALQGGEVSLERSFLTAEVAADPGVLVEALAGHSPFDLVLGPAGYGLPLVPVAQVGDRELALMMLVREDEAHGPVGVGGMRSIVRALDRRRPAARVRAGRDPPPHRSPAIASGTASTSGPPTRSRAPRCASPTRRCACASSTRRRRS